MLKVKKYWVSDIIQPIRGARLSHGSLDKSDSIEHQLGEKDLSLALRLSKAGSSHRKFLRQIHVKLVLEAPWKFFKEFATYRVGVTENSSSMMHTLTKRPLTEDDFAWKKTTELRKQALELTNKAIKKYNETGEYKDWEELMDIVPGGFKYTRFVSLNYENLANIYKQRKNHKMREWHEFCYWIEALPYSELITISAKGGK